MKKRFWKGLRTIDLVIGLVVICMVLANIVINYDDFKCRSMQSEAKFALREIYAAQKLFFAENERFASTEQLVKIDKRLVLPQKYYTLSDLRKPTATGFLVVARGNKDFLVSGEEWTVDQQNDLLLRKAICKD